ncbi:hypothetical protein JOF56_003010 [Kibdelosporangium banguiense]|uniref:Uncharacterized protein n=1 Tax=Kibdelosporangium banguiense TaxID=1365924 RepID=A0ABS4TEW6_9PSEU|nr:hypothetical protein [Kibdelosporangium banguiense]MBP2322625.1 hypothetical protein [Kibdelosporangium banguiense]
MTEIPIEKALASLRLGLGARDPRNVDKLDHRLREAWQIPVDAERHSVLNQIAKEVDRLSEYIPDNQLRFIYRAAYGLEPEIPQRELGRRRVEIMRICKMGERTERKEEDRAISLVASYIVLLSDAETSAPIQPSSDKLSSAYSDQSFPRARNFRVDDWLQERVDISIFMEWYNKLNITEEHNILATEDNLTDVCFLLTLPVREADSVEHFELEIRDGGKRDCKDPAGYRSWGYGQPLQKMVASNEPGWEVSAVSTSCYYVKRTLDRPLTKGENYHFRIDMKINGPILQSYTFSPINRCGQCHFSLTYSPDMKVFPEVYVVKGVPSQTLQDYRTYLCALKIDESARTYSLISPQYSAAVESWLRNYCWYILHDDSISIEFARLKPSFAYGFVLNWTTTAGGHLPRSAN